MKLDVGTRSFSSITASILDRREPGIHSPGQLSGFNELKRRLLHSDSTLPHSLPSPYFVPNRVILHDGRQERCRDPRAS